MTHDEKREEGISSVGILVAVVVLVTIGLGGFGVWSFSNYQHQKNDTDAIVNTAVQKAIATQKDADDKTNFEKNKLPTIRFSGPSDLGSVAFQYPKTWATYVANSGADGYFTAYLYPQTVPTVSDTQKYALRVTIEQRSYEYTLQNYENLVKIGKLKSSPLTTNGLNGIRLEGQFSEAIDGVAAIFKVRDKTLTIRTDSPTFKGDFNDTIIPSLTFTP